MQVDSHDINITRPDKVLFPEDGITKGDLIDYYLRVADAMLPHVQERPISMLRFPDGIDKLGFYQKDASYYFPEWIHTEELAKKEGGTVDYVIIDDAATLVYLANQACITPHVFLSRIVRINYPDRMIFDLDPSDNDFALVVQGAKDLHGLLKDAGLTPFVMTTGSRGLHVTVPLDHQADFDTVRAFAHEVAQTLVSLDPQHYTTEQRVKQRGDKLFIDALRNSYAATAVPPYAVRPKNGAPVATPLRWEELDDKRLTSQSYNIRNLFDRLKEVGDPWAEIERYQGAIQGARRQFEGREAA